MKQYFVSFLLDFFRLQERKLKINNRSLRTHMFLSLADSIFFKNRAECFSNSKLHALDQYWSINNSHPMHQQIHEIIENILNSRGEKSIRQSRLDLIRNFERSLSLSNPMGRLSANIISFISYFVFSSVDQNNLRILK